MSTTVITLLSGIAAVVGGYFAFKNNPNKVRKEAEKAIRKKEDEIEAEKADIRNAVYNGDDEQTNKFLASMLMVLMALAFFATFFVGCVAEKPVVYVPADRRVYSVTNEAGIACKMVPDVVFAEMCEKLIELKHLKAEAEVDKRLGTTK